MKKAYLTPQKKTESYEKQKSQFTAQKPFKHEEIHKEQQQENQLDKNESEHNT